MSDLKVLQVLCKLLEDEKAMDNPAVFTNLRKLSQFALDELFLFAIAEKRKHLRTSETRERLVKYTELPQRISIKDSSLDEYHNNLEEYNIIEGNKVSLAGKSLKPSVMSKAKTREQYIKEKKKIYNRTAYDVPENHKIDVILTLIPEVFVYQDSKVHIKTRTEFTKYGFTNIVLNKLSNLQQKEIENSI